MWTLLFVSTKRNRGHIKANTASRNPGNKEAASKRPGATRDRSGDAFAGSFGIESGETTRRQREPGVPLAEVVSRRAAWKPDGRRHYDNEGRRCLRVAWWNGQRM